MAGTVKLTEKEVSEIKDSAYFVITQKEMVDDAEKEAVRRAPVNNVKNTFVKNLAPGIVKNESGNAITINDASNMPLQGLNVYGKSEQLTTTGKNLLDPTDSAFGSSIGNAGSPTVIGSTIKLPVTASAKQYGVKIFDGVLPVGTYTLSAEKVSNTGTYDNNSYGWYIKVYEEDDNPISLKTAIKENSVTFEIDKEYIRVYIQYYVGMPYAGTDGTLTISNVQLELGSTATGYEPYTGGIPSPNPDYPQEIESVENPEIYVHNQNMLWKLADKTVTAKGVTFTLADGVLTAKGTATETIYTVEGVSGDIAWNITYYCKAKMTLVTPKVKENITTLIRVRKDGRNFFYSDGDKVTFDGTETDAYAYFWITSGAVVDETIIPCIFNSDYDGTEDMVVADRQTLSVPYTLRGIPVTSGGNYTDADGQQWVCDEIDFERGMLVQRVKEKVLGELSAIGINIDAISGTAQSTFLSFNDRKHTGYTVSAKCTHFKVYGDQQIIQDGNMVGCAFNSNKIYGNYFYIGIPVSLLNGNETVSGLKQWLSDNNVSVIYPLETPLEIALTNEELEAYRALHTNKPYTTVFNDQNAGLSIGYGADTKTYIDNKFEALNNAILSLGGNI